MVSCHRTQPNYKTTQHCAHSWGARPPVTRGKIDDVSVTCRAETHPDISALLSAHVKQGNTGPHDTTLRDTPTCPHKILHTRLYNTHWKHTRKPHPPVGLHLWSLHFFLHSLSCVIMCYQQVKAEWRCRCWRSNHVHHFWVWPLTQWIKQSLFQSHILTVEGWKPYNLILLFYVFNS